MRIVITGPVIQRIARMSVVLAEVTSLAGTLARSVFPAVLLHQLRLAVEYRVWGVMTEVEKERPVLVPFDEIDGLVVHPIDQELGLPQSVFRNIDPADRLFPKDIRPEVRSVPDTLHLTGKVPGEAVPARLDLVLGPVKRIPGQVPLADHARGVPTPTQCLGQRDVPRRECIGGIGSQVVENTDPRRILAGQQSRPVRGADRSRGVGLGEPHAVSCQPIQVSCLVEPVAIAAQFSPSEIISQNKDDIGPIRRVGRQGRQKQGQEQATGSHGRSRRPGV